jgi:hypothetical protein
MQTTAQAEGLDLESARASWVQLETRNDWELVRPLGGVLIIADATGARYHGPGCVLAAPGLFEESVIDRRAAGLDPDASYFWAARPWCAEAGGARRCDHAADPLAGG